MKKISAAARLRSAVEPSGIDAVRSLELKIKRRILKKVPSEQAPLHKLLLDLEKTNITPSQLESIQDELTHICSASVVEADTETEHEDHTGESDERHWILRVKSVMRLAKGQGAMRIAEADTEHNTVTIQMKPAVYLDPVIMLKLIMIFKKEHLALMIQAHSNYIFLTVGPEGFLEEQTGARV